MALNAHALRYEARLLSARIEAVETTARHCRGLAAITPNADIAVIATEHAVLAERAALRLASRLSRITRSLPDA